MTLDTILVAALSIVTGVPKGINPGNAVFHSTNPGVSAQSKNRFVLMLTKEIIFLLSNFLVNKYKHLLIFTSTSSIFTLQIGHPGSPCDSGMN